MAARSRQAMAELLTVARADIHLETGTPMAVMVSPQAAVAEMPMMSVAATTGVAACPPAMRMAVAVPRTAEGTHTQAARFRTARRPAELRHTGAPTVVAVGRAATEATAAVVACLRARTCSTASRRPAPSWRSPSRRARRSWGSSRGHLHMCRRRSMVLAEVEEAMVATRWVMAAAAPSAHSTAEQARSRPRTVPSLPCREA
mmetsp:Transcript_11013/g.38823  ORF Transcript_11013/g.38823 Transcript_11013/m.38823 type:complete len:202 (-) Transcript_11013:502-1107(-)